MYDSATWLSIGRVMEINVEIWVALIGATALLIGYLIGATALLIGYLIQRQNEIKLKITEKKRSVYVEFLKDYAMATVAIDHDKKLDQVELGRRRKLERNQLLLYASDNVIKAYNKWIKYWEQYWEKYYDENSEIERVNEDPEIDRILLLEIRKDILGKTKLTVEDIINFNPFKSDK